MEGWIQLHRQLLVSDIFQNEKMLKVFVYCLLKASHKEHKQKVGRQTVELKPGQFIFGRKKASIELNMNESTLRDYMYTLRDDNTIDIKSANKFSVITIVNWELYQSKEENSDNKKTTKRQQKDTNNNGNNENNGNKEKDYTSKIKDLLPVFQSISNFNQLNKEYWDCIRETRKTGNVSKSVIYKTMKKWEKYDLIVIEYAIKTHIEQHKGKKEEYTIGIMRGTKPEEAQERLDISNVIPFNKKKTVGEPIDWDNL